MNYKNKVLKAARLSLDNSAKVAVHDSGRDFQKRYFITTDLTEIDAKEITEMEHRLSSDTENFTVVGISVIDGGYIGLSVQFF